MRSPRTRPRSHSPRSNQAGFTLPEMLSVVAIAAATTGFMAMKMIEFSERQAVRDASQTMIGYAREAQSAARLIGSATGTTRVTNIDPDTGQQTCPSEFSSAMEGAAARGRAALVVDVNEPGLNPNFKSIGNSITFIDRVERIQATSPPTYLITCKTRNFTALFHNKVVLEPDGAAPLPMSGSGRYMVTYDGRGFVTNMPGSVAAIKLRRPGLDPQRVLIFGSGESCVGGGDSKCVSGS